MFSIKERITFENASRIVGDKIIALAKNKKSVGSFVETYDNQQVMTFLPCFQQGIGGAPVGNDIFMQTHQAEEIDKINSFDLAFIFKFQFGDDDIFIETINEQKHYIVVQTNNLNNLSNMMFSFMISAMNNNPYIKKENVH